MFTTKDEARRVIEIAAKSYGFKVTENPFNDLGIMIESEELNFTYRCQYDWDTLKEGYSIVKVVMQASVRRCGGNPTADELFATANEISKGACFVQFINDSDLTYKKTIEGFTKE